MKHEEFAQRAGRRLEAVADRLEGEGKRLGIDGEASRITSRAQELRVAALMVRDESAAVVREEHRKAPHADGRREPVPGGAGLGRYDDAGRTATENLFTLLYVPKAYNGKVFWQPYLIRR